VDGKTRFTRRFLKAEEGTRTPAGIGGSSNSAFVVVAVLRDDRGKAAQIVPEQYPAWPCLPANAESRHLNPWRRLGSELRWRGRVAGVGSACARPC
jgi:hypothetical protein